MIQYMPIMKHANGMQSLEQSRKVVKRLMLYTEHEAIILLYNWICFLGFKCS